MDRMLYIAMSGAKQTMQAQAANNNNLANATTVGFRADLEHFRSMPVFGPGWGSRVYAMNERPATDLTGGSIQTTGRALDVAINGEGWFAVEGKDGREGYTRAGDFHLDENGQMRNGEGLPVLGDGGPITIPPYEKLEIGDDGTITIQPLGQGPDALAVIGRLKLVKPPQELLEKDLDGLMRQRDGETALAEAVRVVPGALEGSNVNAVEAMVNMMTLSRQYEMQVKMMKQASENAVKSAQVLQII